MQFLSRGPSEAIHIGPEIRLRLTGVRGERVRLRIETPSEVRVGRTRCGESKVAEVPSNSVIQKSHPPSIAECPKSTGPLLVLLVDDSMSDRSRVRALLPTHRELVVVEAGTDAADLKAIERMQPDLVLLGLRTPECDGVRLVESLRKVWPGPLVMLAQKRCVATATRALQAGAADYLTKQEVTAHALERYLTTAAKRRAAPKVAVE